MRVGLVLRPRADAESTAFSGALPGNSVRQPNPDALRRTSGNYVEARLASASHQRGFPGRPPVSDGVGANFRNSAEPQRVLSQCKYIQKKKSGLAGARASPQEPPPTECRVTVGVAQEIPPRGCMGHSGYRPAETRRKTTAAPRAAIARLIHMGGPDAITWSAVGSRSVSRNAASSSGLYPNGPTSLL